MRTKILLALAALILIPTAALAETAADKHARLKRILNMNMRMPSSALNEMSAMLDDVWWYDTRANLAADTARTEGTLGCAEDTNSCYMWMGSLWKALDPYTPEFKINFNEGASKGIQNMQSDGTAWDSTAATLNYVYYGNYVLGAMMVVDVGNTVPTADAGGLDITAGNVTDNDHVSYWTGTLGTSGRPLVIGTDPAFKFCVTIKPADVSGSDSFYCGIRTADPVTVSIASYTDYCAIGYISGNYGVQDKTTGATDAGTSTIADTVTDTICTLVSAAGACTYTIDGAAPNATDPHTLGDGLLVIPWCELRHDADGADDQLFVDYEVAYQ